MTIATRLILCRRSRPSRPHDDDVESSPTSSLPRRRHHHRDELEVSPRASHHGRFHSHRSSHSGHESARLDHNCSGEFGTGTSSNLGNMLSQVNSRLRSIRSERLPGTVLEARARLLERLRSVSLSETRQTPATGAISWDEFLVTSDINLIDSVNWEAENLTDFTVQARGTSSSLNELQKKKSPGLGWDTLCSICQEVYTDAVATDGVTRASLECGICLEKFMLGDELIKLQCSHRFHLTCLEPWVRSSGDCPYCRAILFNTENKKKNRKTMSDQQQLMRPETDAGKEEKGRAMEELPLQSSPYVKYSDMEVYKLHDYDSEDHLPTIKTTRRGGSAAGSPSHANSAANSPSLARSLSLKVRAHPLNNSKN